MQPLGQIFQEVSDHLRDDAVSAAAADSSEALLTLVHREAEKLPSFQSFVERSRDGRDTGSREECLELKEVGTKAFQKDEHAKAIRVYSAFIEMATMGEFKDLQYQGYSNRSLILYDLGLNRAVAEDISTALALAPGLSAKDRAMEFVLLDRRAKSHIRMERFDLAKPDLEAALVILKGQKGDAILPQIREVFKKQIEDLLKKVKVEVNSSKKKKNKGNKKEEEDESDVKEKLGFFAQLLLDNDDPSLQYLQATKNIIWNEKAEIVSGGPEVGRFLRARTDIHPGELIAVEAPLVSFSQCEAGQSKVCHHCMGRFCLEGALYLPSTSVPGVRFCSRPCSQKADKTYHKYERFVLADYLATLEVGEHVELSGCMFLAFRALVHRQSEFYTSDEAKRIIGTLEPDYGTGETLEQLDSEHNEEFKFLWNLCDHDETQSLTSKLQIAIRSVILLKVLRETGYFSDYKSQHQIVLHALYRLQTSIAFNVHTVYHVGGDISGDIPLAPVGSAVYRNLVLLNHSCAVNTTRFYHGKRMMLVAKRKIRAGEEISNNYGFHHLQLPRDRRQQRLEHDYKFVCHCEACKDDYPGMKLSPADIKSKPLKKQLDKLLRSYQQSFTEGDLAGARKHVEQYLTRLEEAGIKYPHRNYEIGAIALNSCWWAVVARENEFVDMDAEKE